jgi:hypothetical protein
MGLVIAIHGNGTAETLHAQTSIAVTSKVPTPPPAGIDALVGEI